MATTSLSCPECNKVLKSATPLPAGKKVRCPQCQAVFTVGKAKGQTNGQPNGKPSGKPTSFKAKTDTPFPAGKRPRPLDDEEDEDRPPPARRRPVDDDDEDMPARKSKRRATLDDDDDFDIDEIDDEDLPRKSAKSKKKKKTKPQGNGMMFGLVLGGVGLLVVVFVLTAFVWPGFLTPSRPAVAGGAAAGGGPAAGPPRANPFAFLPNKGDVLMGIDFGFTSIAKYRRLMDKIVLEAQKEDVPREVVNILSNLDRSNLDRALLIADWATESATVVVTTRSAFDPETIKIPSSEQINIQGKKVFRVKVDKSMIDPAAGVRPGRPPGGVRPGGIRPGGINPGGKKSEEKIFHLAMPTNQVLLFTDLPQAELGTLLGSDGKMSRISADLLNQARNLEHNTIWVLVNLEGKIRNELDDLRQMEKTLGLQIVDPLKRAKMGSLAVDVGDKSIKLNLGLTCGNDKDAVDLKGQLGKLWKEQVPSLVSMAQLIPGLPPELTKVVKQVGNDLTGTFQIQNQGANLTAAVQITETTMNEIAKLIPQPPGGNAGQLPGGGKGFPGGGKGFPGGQNPGANLPPQNNPNALAGSTWSGSETLAGYGRLAFAFQGNGQVTMDDKDGKTPGSYVQTGNSVTLTFQGTIRYTGTVSGRDMSGSATNGKDRWTWTVKRQ